MAYAVIKTGGKQYRVSQGDMIDVEKLDIEPGQVATIEEVLMVSNDGKIRVGNELQGAQVLAEVIDHAKGPKGIAYKYKRRKGYHRKVGYRRSLTRLVIKSIPA